jgi:hypothetical protein
VWIRIWIQEAKNIRYGSDGSGTATLLATQNIVDVPAELDAEGLNLDEELSHIDNLVPNKTLKIYGTVSLAYGTK